MNARADIVLTMHSSSQVPSPPLRWTGCNTGLGNVGQPDIRFVDGAGQKWLTHSVEAVLRMIDHFPDERDRRRLLAGAADHYGFDDAWILIKGRDADEPLWDVLDDSGRLLLGGVTHHAGWLATEQLRQLPGWASGFRFVLHRAPSITSDEVPN